jgi:hypothetical protein
VLVPCQASSNLAPSARPVISVTSKAVNFMKLTFVSELSTAATSHGANNPHKHLNVFL